MSGPDCLVCGGDRFQPYLDILLKCPACGFVTARLDEAADARKLYDGDYFTGREYLDYRADERLFKRTFRKRLRRLLRYRPGGRLLEIGSAYGFFLDLARHHFDVVGFEPNHEAARYARDHFGVDVRTDDFLQIDPTEFGEPFDIAVMWDVIEHLERPDLFVARIAELSRPGAVLALTTGDIGSRLARWRGRKWRLIHPPTHLHHFDRRTITRLLANHGFDVIDIRSAGTAHSVRQILYSVLALGLQMRRAYTAISKLVPAWAGFTLNTFDIMRVTALKTSR